MKYTIATPKATHLPVVLAIKLTQVREGAKEATIATVTNAAAEEIMAINA